MAIPATAAQSQETAGPTAAKDPQLPTVTVQSTKRAPPAKKKKIASARKVSSPQAPPPVVPESPPYDANLNLIQVDGTAVEGYRVSTLSDVGPFGSRPILTTPYSISVLSKDLIENTQSTSTDDLFRLDPFIHNMWPVARGNPISTVIRGFNTSTSMLDNMRLFNASVINPEGLERVEVLSGLSGFLYGPSDPGGVINYVMKSPTRTSFADITGGLINDSGYVHADVGGPVAPGAGTFYRFNVVRQDGGTAVDDQNVERTYLSGALDFQISDGALLQLKGFHSDYHSDGADPFWLFEQGISRYPSAPDASKLWGQHWGYNDDVQDGGDAKFSWDINKVFTVRAGFLYIQEGNDSISINNDVASTDGTYSQQAIANAAGTLTTEAGYAAVDTKFAIGDVRQTITTGYSASHYKSALPLDPFAFIALPGTFNFNDPTFIAKPAIDIGNEPESTFFTRDQRNAFIGDSIDFGKYWSAIVGVNYATILSEDFDFLPPPGEPRAKDASYDKSAWTPTASLIFKPTEWAAIYGSYMQGLEQGEVAPPDAKNPNAVLPPYLSEQYEVGTKLQLGGALLTVAGFDITKAYAFLDTTDGFFKAAGRQHNQGVEVGLSGKVTDDLSLFGGFTAVHARIEDDPTLAGMRPMDVPAEIFKMYAEYRVPQIPGLVLTGGLNYFSDFAGFADNSQFLPDVWTGDLGFRYETTIHGTPFITRFMVNNVTDESYWMSSRFLGAPRTMMLTAETKF